MRRLWILATPFGFACSGGDVPDQLEAITVTGEVPDLSGRFAVTGEDRDYTLTLEDDSTVTVAVHTPTGAPLGELDGRDLIFETDEFDFGVATGTLRASDDAPVWLAFRGGYPGLVDEWFGEQFAVLGPRVAREHFPGIRRDHHAVTFATDDGEVDLLPGAVDTLTVDGVLWRVGVVAAYHDEDPHPGNSKCSLYATTLQFELLRVDAEVEPAQLGRAAELEMAQQFGLCG